MTNFFPIVEIKISTFEEFIIKFSDSIKHIKENIDNSELSQEGKNILIQNKYDKVLYRGQENLEFELMPKIGRKGFYVKKETEKTEIEVFEEFKRRNFSHLDRFNSINDWDLLAIAQHHGLPTRLLDWTENPLVALWFAFATETNNVKNRVVWAFLPLNDEIVTEKTKGGPYNQTETKVFKPRHTNNRIIAQQGWFTVHKFSKNSTFVPFNKNNKYNKRLMKFTIPNELRNEILNKLDKLGVNFYSIFPDTEGLCKYLQWKTFQK